MWRKVATVGLSVVALAVPTRAEVNKPGTWKDMFFPEAYGLNGS